ncbi:hypothetical protein QQ045_031660 [Rhodiola kirilowii]
MLQTAPSLDVYISARVEGGRGEDGDLLRSVTIGDKIIDALGSADFTFEERGMGLIEEKSEEAEESEQDVEFMIGGDSVNGSHGNVVSANLRKEAQLLLSNGDLEGAEDYLYRCTVADPRNGEILLQYAKVLWQLHRDRDRASKYFECAALAAPENSDVLGAYASFLWEIEVDEGNDEDTFVEEPLSSSVEPVGASTNIEEYYRKMVEVNSSDPLFLKTYSQFLYQSKQDLHGAEEYYARAIQANPEDGEIMSQYARLIWELHHDQVKAVSYFERAVELAPGDCDVTAAYASFLWDIGEDEEEEEHVAQA